MSYNNKKLLWFVILIVSVAGIFAGYSFWKARDTKTPIQPTVTVGIIDMNKAVKAHPRYNEVTALEQQINALKAKAGAQNQAGLDATIGQAVQDMPLPNPTSGINAALEQEYNAKMYAKKAELSAALQAKAEKQHASLSAELKAYSEELDKTYQPQIFSLQLKLKTVQLTKEEMAELQGQLEKLQNERASKISAKEKMLAARLNELMAPEQTAIEQQLAAYSQQLNAELSQKGAAQSAEIAQRNQAGAPSAPTPKVQAPPSNTGEIEQQIAVKQREMDAVKQFILDDIRDKTAKIAAERKLETVLANIKVNINAIDITGIVISQLSAPSIKLQ